MTAQLPGGQNGPTDGFGGHRIKTPLGGRVHAPATPEPGTAHPHRPRWSHGPTIRLAANAATAPQRQHWRSSKPPQHPGCSSASSCVRTSSRRRFLVSEPRRRCPASRRSGRDSGHRVSTPGLQHRRLSSEDAATGHRTRTAVCRRCAGVMARHRWQRSGLTGIQRQPENPVAVAAMESYSTSYRQTGAVQLLRGR